MRLAVVGVGGAGSRIANRTLAVERASGRNLCNGNALLIGSTPTEFDEKEHVPEERRLLIGDTYGAVEGR
ncbi:MAG TPA: cell division protein, partial [Halobacteriales archaeon]|nr:cell division protein [Halobacteriales archaeon]